MLKTKRKFTLISAILILAVVLITAAFGCKEEPKQEDIQPIELNFWGVFDDSQIFEPIIKAYKQIKPNVTITYRKLTFEEYEDAVIEGLASGKGPDIWSIHNTWLPKHQNKLATMPNEVMTPLMYSDTFVEVATDDFVVDDQIYGLPLSVDTLALYYNKDLLNTEGIVSAPQTWEDFKDDVKKLTKTDIQDTITQSGAAIGTAENINRAVDILYLLMLQNGTQMVNERHTEATFDLPDETEKDYFPGTTALTFYTDFANPNKEIYTWNPEMPYSIDAFTDEQAVMTFNYSYQRSYLKTKAPNLNYDIAPAPQIAGAQKTINYANYWAYVVSNSSMHQNEAWNFLNFMADKENVEAYTQKTDRPASRIDVLETQLDDPSLKVFAKQALTAKSWYQADPAQTEGLFSAAIDEVVAGTETPSEIIRTLAEQVTSLMK